MKHTGNQPIRLPRLAPTYCRNAADTGADPVDVLAAARAFAEPLIAGELLDTGENTLAHAAGGGAHPRDDRRLGPDAGSQLPGLRLRAPDPAAGSDHQALWRQNLADLAMETTKLVQVQRQARSGRAWRRRGERCRRWPQSPAAQVENVRKMLLAFSRDLRVVMLRLASRLQTLRYFAASKPGTAAGHARGGACWCSRRWPTGWASGN
jgi:GTP pyrophosphokinase